MFNRRNSKQKNATIKVTNFKTKDIPIRENGDNYYYVDNYEQATEKECREFDKVNQIIYEKYINTYNKIKKKISGCPFKLDKEPVPPRTPNNYESLIKWRLMNETKNVTQQTTATLYLLSKGYKISLDHNIEGITPNEIIQKAETKCKNNYEKMKEDAYKFIEELEQGAKQQQRTKQQHQTKQQNNTKKKHYSLELNYETTSIASNTSSENSIVGFKEIKRSVSDNHLRCLQPEHHSTSNKIKHFNKIYPSINVDAPLPSAPPPPQTTNYYNQQPPQY